MHTQPGDRNYNTERRKYDELQNSKLIIEHHLSFANDCISKNIFPLGLKTFVPCVVYKTDDHLKEEWKRVLNNTSIELLALCKDHSLKLLEKTKEEMY